MKNHEHILGDVPLSTFLQEYWQQKPLLIRGAIKHYSSPISADEMAGFACEPDVESRIILERDGDIQWQCQHGPFEEKVFSTLPESHWTLLVQSCNLYVAELAQLLEQFRFMPNWRVDDVMVSYAAPGGSVGPHTDNYDVFLLQAQGKRHWSISTQTFTESDFIPNLDLKILKSFVADQSWVLEAGDMLYLPPGVAHHGVADDDANDDCITLSIGFRAPNIAELSTALLDEVLIQQTIDTTSFYQDPHLPLQENPGEISAAALEKINKMVQQAIDSGIQAGDWFGKYITNTTSEQPFVLSEITPQQCRQRIFDGQQLVRNESSKFAFFLSEHNDAEKIIHFYCCGQVEFYPYQLYEIVRLVCNHRYPAKDLLISALANTEAQLFLANLINQGHLYFESDLSEDDY